MIAQMKHDINGPINYDNIYFIYDIIYMTSYMVLCIGAPMNR